MNYSEAITGSVLWSHFLDARLLLLLSMLVDSNFLSDNLFKIAWPLVSLSRLPSFQRRINQVFSFFFNYYQVFWMKSRYIFDLRVQFCLLKLEKIRVRSVRNRLMCIEFIKVVIVKTDLENWCKNKFSYTQFNDTQFFSIQ